MWADSLFIYIHLYFNINKISNWSVLIYNKYKYPHGKIRLIELEGVREERDSKSINNPPSHINICVILIIVMII